MPCGVTLPVATVTMPIAAVTSPAATVTQADTTVTMQSLRPTSVDHHEENGGTTGVRGGHRGGPGEGGVVTRPHRLDLSVLL